MQGGGSSYLTHPWFYWIYVEINQPGTFTLSRLSPLLPSTVHAKYSSDPDRMHLSSQALINTTVPSSPFHVLEEQLYMII